MKTKIVVANWKANVPDFSHFSLPELVTTEVAIAPQFPLISSLTLKGVSLCSQDISSFPRGAYTGQVTGEALKIAGVKYVLVGHSETKKWQESGSQTILEKCIRAWENSLIPIICASTLTDIPGKLTATNTSNEAPSTLRSGYLLPTLRRERNPSEAKNSSLSSPSLRSEYFAKGDKQFYLMYEPESAISSPNDFHPENPDQVRGTVTCWKEKYPQASGFLYGGSITPENIREYLNLKLLSGFVVGQTSLNPEAFARLLTIIDSFAD